VCRSKHVEQLRNTGIINSTTRSHLVGYFCKIYELYICRTLRQNLLFLNQKSLSWKEDVRIIFAWACYVTECMASKPLIFPIACLDVSLLVCRYLVVRHLPFISTTNRIKIIPSWTNFSVS